MGYTAKALGVGFFLVVCVAGCAERQTPVQPPTVAPAPRTESPSAPPPPIRGQKPYQIYGVWYYPIPSAEGFVETGNASWYGPNFHGLPTACGEPYDMYAMTAAHKILPLGTHVKVTNLNNGKSVVLRINDRGPFVDGRVIDLSLRAAQLLDTARPGVAPVRVEAVQVASEQNVAGNTVWQVQPVPDFRRGNFYVQIGAFQEQRNAERLKLRMANRYGKTQVIPYNNFGTLLYRVQVGVYTDLPNAQQEMHKLRQQGFTGAFVVASEEK